MPYKWATDKVKLPPGKDRRVKLSSDDKREIKRLYSVGDTSYQKLADRFSVSKRSIQFIIKPEKLVENLKRREERGGWRQYYDKDERTASQREHRQYKTKILAG